ncbi:MAG: hypothetical protein GX096_13015 [Clostridiales bacterium]|nr:hypothetical protein [Clostridiales bacterium]
MNKKERVFRNAARYLGYQKKALDSDALELLDQAYDELHASIKPMHILREYSVKVDGDEFTFGDIAPIISPNLAKLFCGAAKGYGMLATLGAPLDMRIKRLMITSPALGAALSSCASAYIDEYIDEFLAELDEKLAADGLTLSPRFSPGYGDMPLSYQKPLLAVLEARRIGVALTDGFLMLPEKSVSAVVAVKEKSLAETCKEEEGESHRCESCSLTTCAYRKE